MVSKAISIYWTTLKLLYQRTGSKSYKHAVTTIAALSLVPERTIMKRRCIEAGEKIPRFPGWHGTVAAGMVATISTLLINVVLLIWALTLNLNRWGVASPFEGSCATTKRISTWSHIGINILSTLLLGASNNAMQCLLSPTREEVDEAHSEGRWLSIGAPSLTNLVSIGRHRRRLIIILGVSSLPLHLLYNSIIYTTLSVNEYWAMLAGSDFAHPAPWRIPDIDEADFVSNIDFLRQNYQSFQRLENAECIQAYKGDVSAWSNVVMVAYSEQFAGSSVYEVFKAAAFNNSACAWQCCGNLDSPLDPSFCNFDFLTSHANEWNITVTRSYRQRISINHCLALPSPSSSQCTVNISCDFLATVILCNLIKVICLVSVLKLEFQPLTTTGDAVASFLEIPDSYTEGLCLVSARDVVNGRRIRMPWERRLETTKCFPLTWYSLYRKCRKGASLRRWYVYNMFSVGVLLTSGIVFVSSSPTRTAGLGLVTANAVISSTANLSLLGNIILVNVPQLLASFFYVMYNGILTSMCQSSEYGKFTTERKALRVTLPRGLQRSTYYLELPYRYSIPLLTMFAILHWLISETMFPIRVKIFDTNNDPRDIVNACGYSGLGFLLVILTGGLMMFALWALGSKEYQKSIPIVSDCSFAISATCHRLPEDIDASIHPLMWGVVETREDGVGHASFSSKEVTPLVPGQRYA